MSIKIDNMGRGSEAYHANLLLGKIDVFILFFHYEF